MRHYGNNAELSGVKHGAVLFERVYPFVFGAAVWRQVKQDNLWPLFPQCVLSVQVCLKLFKVQSFTICHALFIYLSPR